MAVIFLVLLVRSQLVTFFLLFPKRFGLSLPFVRQPSCLALSFQESSERMDLVEMLESPVKHRNR